MNFKNKQHSEEELKEFAKQDLFEDDWFDISTFQKLSENFIQEFQNKINWSCASQFQNLSESFIREFQDKVNWICISWYQNLSEGFIREFQNKINWHNLRYNKKIQVSDKFTIEFDKKLGCYNIWIINNQLHRILGPAYIYDNGEKEYWYRGKYVEVKSDEEYFEWLKYKDF